LRGQAKADLRASIARVRVRLEREREAPARSVHLCEPRARTLSFRLEAAWRLRRCMSLDGREKGRRSVVIGGAMHDHTRSKSPFCAPACNGVGGGGVVCADEF